MLITLFLDGGDHLFLSPFAVTQRPIYSSVIFYVEIETDASPLEAVHADGFGQ